ncbi:hypothetical protein OE88DRAFT_806916 [Heliocybe sulcata]|uniref:BTB domain-containing protein n=1 Tax=Heliocybe sulcata TaxID=5364 RepID=A0A5C3MRI8_9AGAM|nr:hypothetical protein OE88DRAFT_806916 [Heliocybe sulcata]
MEQPITRSTDLWFKDGNVVLQAESMLFKVFRGILAINSEIFKAMFALPLPQTPDVYEGQPLVIMNDSAEDLTYFLSAIFYRAALRRSTKYSAVVIRQRIVDQLSGLYPATLAGCRRAHPPWKGILARRPSLAVYLGKLCDIPAILPAAFLLWARDQIVAILSENPTDSEGGELATILGRSNNLFCWSRGHYEHMGDSAFPALPRLLNRGTL